MPFFDAARSKLFTHLPFNVRNCAGKLSEHCFDCLRNNWLSTTLANERVHEFLVSGKSRLLARSRTFQLQAECCSSSDFFCDLPIEEPFEGFLRIGGVAFCNPFRLSEVEYAFHLVFQFLSIEVFQLNIHSPHLGKPVEFFIEHLDGLAENIEFSSRFLSTHRHPNNVRD